PEFRSLELPNASTKIPQLVAAAGAMANATSKHTQVFLDGGLAADFAVQLTTAASDLQQSVDLGADSRAQRSGATSALAAEEARGRLILTLLDSIITPRLGADSRLRAEWAAVIRLPRHGSTRTAQSAPASPNANPTS